MAEFIYTTSYTGRGPWLIDADRLEELDVILGEEEARLSKRSEERLNAEVERQLQNDYVVEAQIADIDLRRKLFKIDDTDRQRGESLTKNDDAEKIDKEAEIEKIKQKRREEISARLVTSTFSDYLQSRSLTIRLKKNKKVVVKSFGEALREQSLIEEMPVGFTFVLRNGEIKCTIEMRQDGSLDISVSPEHLPESRELFAALQRWVIPMRPPTWQQLWVFLNPIQWILWFVLLLIIGTVIEDSKSYAKQTFTNQANQLLKDGISQEEQLKAIETILALQADYIPPGQQSHTPGWLNLLIFGGLTICLVLTFAPKSLIGIGRGQEAIGRWRKWMRFVFIIVPGFIFLNIVWPWLSNIIGHRLQ